MCIEDPLPVKIREVLRKKLRRIKQLDIRQLAGGKKNIILGAAIVALSVGLFVYPGLKKEAVGFFSEKRALAQKEDRRIAGDLDSNQSLCRVRKDHFDPNEVTEKFKAEELFIIKEEKKIDPKIALMLVGSPMEEMVPDLSNIRKDVASYLVAIAKKESNWGKHTPKKNGKECYNYWGYRGKENRTASGYSCFDSPSHAVEVVGNRIERLLNQNINTPSKMVVWKCGSNCEAAGGQAAANKWIADVALYYNKLNS